jgi:hypothetical protein
MMWKARETAIWERAARRSGMEGRYYPLESFRKSPADFFRQAADQHTLPTLNYAFVRAKARKMKA